MEHVTQTLLYWYIPIISLNINNGAERFDTNVKCLDHFILGQLLDLTTFMLEYKSPRYFQKPLYVSQGKFKIKPEALKNILLIIYYFSFKFRFN